MPRLIGKNSFKGKKGEDFSKLYFVEDFPVGKPDCDGMMCFEEFTDYNVATYEVGKDYSISYEKNFAGKARFNGMKEIPS